MSFEKIFLSLAIIIATSILAFTAYTLKTQQLRNDAVNGCLQTSGIYQFTNVKENVVATAPQKEFYNICMTDKGYLSSWK